MAQPLGGQCQAVSKATGQRCRLCAQHVANGVPRSTATATRSTKRASGLSVVRSAMPSSAWTRPDPVRAWARARRNSRASSLVLTRATLTLPYGWRRRGCSE